MLIVLLVICVIMIVASLILCDYPEDNPTSWIGSIGSVVIVITMAFMMNGLVGERTINQKIEMYQEENSNIETTIAETVKDYMKYEENIVDKGSNSIKNINIVLLTQLYPELKSSELVNKQIEVYVNNNEKIKQLKEEKINIDVYKWWVYFGKSN